MGFGMFCPRHNDKDPIFRDVFGVRGWVFTLLLFFFSFNIYIFIAIIF